MTDTSFQPPIVLPRIAAGEPGAMRTCIDQYMGLVWRLAQRILPNPADIEDAVQDVFIALWTHCDRFDPAAGNEVGFVAMIARRRLIDRGRSHLRRVRREHAAAESQQAAANEHASGSAAPDDNLKSLLLAEEVERVRAAVDTLPPAQRDLLLQAVREGATHQQLADQSGLPLGTVKTHIRRGLIRVRAILEENALPPTSEGSDQ